jgi:hypothetical protein
MPAAFSSLEGPAHALTVAESVKCQGTVGIPSVYRISHTAHARPAATKWARQGGYLQNVLKHAR